MSEKTRILVVEDESISLQILVQTLRSAEQYEVLSATNAEEGFLIAQREQPLLIISDYHMPGVNGFEFCKMVKAHPDLGRTIFVVCSASGDVASKQEGVNIGADDYLAKPVDGDELLLRVRALLRLKALQDELAEDKNKLETLNQELQEDFHGIIGLLMKVLALRAPEAVARAEQSSVLCGWISDRLGMDENMKRTFSLAGRLKEIGKISLPDELLRKSSAEYSESDRNRFEEYPVLGQLLLGDIPQPKDVALLLRHQNENYDGTGYPDRLSKSQIPLGSRILRGINQLQGLLEIHGHSPSIVCEMLIDLMGTILDPRIGLLIEEYMRVVADPTWVQGKQCTRLEDLKEGMVIACDLISGRGLLLLSKDSTLTRSQIEHLQSLSHFDPIIHELYVYDTTV